MELTEDTLSLLRDEAYVYLCREVVEEKLAALEQEKVAIASTRSPFGVFARKSTRDAFTRSMSTALNNEAALRDRLVQIVRLEDWLQPLLRRDIAAYLDAVSEDYQRFSKIHALLAEWHVGLLALPEMLTAFTRDMRTVREAAASGRRPEARAATALVEIAARVEEHFMKLAQTGAAIAEHACHLGAEEIRLPTLPNLQRVTWVNRLGVIPLGQVGPEIVRVESELRALIIGGTETALARLRGTQEIALQLQEAFLENYWKQLRTHARIHYVEERDLDEVLETLTGCYDGAINAQRRTLASHNPFIVER
jgi:hypothetical protein